MTACAQVVYTTPFYVAGQSGSGGWNDVYNADIMPAGLTPSQQAHVLGAEICMWGESLDAGNIGVSKSRIITSPTSCQNGAKKKNSI